MSLKNWLEKIFGKQNLTATTQFLLNAKHNSKLKNEGLLSTEQFIDKISQNQYNLFSNLTKEFVEKEISKNKKKQLNWENIEKELKTHLIEHGIEIHHKKVLREFPGTLRDVLAAYVSDGKSFDSKQLTPEQAQTLDKLMEKKFKPIEGHPWPLHDKAVYRNYNLYYKETDLSLLANECPEYDITNLENFLKIYTDLGKRIFNEKYQEPAQKDNAFKRKLKLALATGLSIAAAITGSFFVYGHFKNELEKLENEKKVKIQEASKRILELENRIKEYNTKLEELNLAEKKLNSEYAERMTALELEHAERMKALEQQIKAFSYKTKALRLKHAEQKKALELKYAEQKKALELEYAQRMKALSNQQEILKEKEKTLTTLKEKDEELNKTRQKLIEINNELAKLYKNQAETEKNYTKKLEGLVKTYENKPLNIHIQRIIESLNNGPITKNQLQNALEGIKAQIRKTQNEEADQLFKAYLTIKDIQLSGKAITNPPTKPEEKTPHTLEEKLELAKEKLTKLTLTKFKNKIRKQRKNYTKTLSELEKLATSQDEKTTSQLAENISYIKIMTNSGDIDLAQKYLKHLEQKQTTKINPIKQKFEKEIYTPEKQFWQKEIKKLEQTYNQLNQKIKEVTCQSTFYINNKQKKLCESNIDELAENKLYYNKEEFKTAQKVEQKLITPLLTTILEGEKLNPIYKKILNEAEKYSLENEITKLKTKHQHWLKNKKDAETVLQKWQTNSFHVTWINHPNFAPLQEKKWNEKEKQKTELNYIKQQLKETHSKNFLKNTYLFDEK